MEHLSWKEIILLAEKTVNRKTYAPAERVLMLHLRNCRICYGKFCGALMVEDMFSPEGWTIEIENEKKRKKNCFFSPEN